MIQFHRTINIESASIVSTCSYSFFNLGHCPKAKEIIEDRVAQFKACSIVWTLERMIGEKDIQNNISADMDGDWSCKRGS